MAVDPHSGLAAEGGRCPRSRLPPLPKVSIRPPAHHFLAATIEQLLHILTHPEQRQQCKPRRKKCYLAGPAARNQAAEYSLQQLQQFGKLAREVLQLLLAHEHAADVLVAQASALPEGRLHRLLALLEAVDAGLLADFLRVSTYNQHCQGDCSTTTPGLIDRSSVGAAAAVELQPGMAVALIAHADPVTQVQRTLHQLPSSCRVGHGGASSPCSSSRQRRKVAAAQHEFAMPQIFRTRVIWTHRKLGEQKLQQLRQLGQVWAGLPEAAVRQRPLSAVQAAGGQDGPRPGTSRRPSLAQQALLHAMQGRPFRRDVALALMSQQHGQAGSEEQQEVVSEAAKYAELVAGLQLGAEHKAASSAAEEPSSAWGRASAIQSACSLPAGPAVVVTEGRSNGDDQPIGPGLQATDLAVHMRHAGGAWRHPLLLGSSLLLASVGTASEGGGRS